MFLLCESNMIPARLNISLVLRNWLYEDTNAETRRAQRSQDRSVHHQSRRQLFGHKHSRAPSPRFLPSPDNTALHRIHIYQQFQTQQHLTTWRPFLHILISTSVKMSVVSLLNVAVRNNPAPFTAPYEFEITFECVEQLKSDLEWKLTYVGSATSSEHDQELDSLLVGPIPVGVNKFIFEAEPPNLARIPNNEILGVTVILLTCSYDGREFVRVGYYVNNEYTDEALIAEPPAKPVIEKVRRNILAEKPRVTRFAIKWDSDESAPAEFPPDQPDADLANDDEEAYGAEEVGEELEEEEEVKAEGEDEEMAGADDTTGPNKEDDDASDAGSEDIEGESSEDEEDDEMEGGGDDDMEMDDDSKAADNKQQHMAAQHADVMVH